MKNFDDFETIITTDVLESIKEEILNKINLHLDENPMESATKEIVWVNRTFSVSFTMRLLEKYHNWLHGN